MLMLAFCCLEEQFESLATDANFLIWASAVPVFNQLKDWVFDKCVWVFFFNSSFDKEILPRIYELNVSS